MGVDRDAVPVLKRERRSREEAEVPGWWQLARRGAVRPAASSEREGDRSGGVAPAERGPEGATVRPEATVAGRGRRRSHILDSREQRESGDRVPGKVSGSTPSGSTPISGRRCAGRRQILPTAVSSAGSQAAMRSSISMGSGASTGTAARSGGSKGKKVPRTGWRFVRHLNRLSALAFLQPVRKVSLGAEFPIPFREPILRPGLPTPLPRAGRPGR
jgi:hypothetical protein